MCVVVCLVLLVCVFLLYGVCVVLCLCVRVVCVYVCCVVCVVCVLSCVDVRLLVLNVLLWLCFV